ncbi:MAG TPA: PKD domain-containing protein, partial [Bacteroidales bacterium]|nr:PKD domain-containing protein [Bacteroidales bacterium]
PAITYNTIGIFDVTMTVTSPYGTEIIQKQNYINVNPLPWPEFTGTPTNVVVNNAVTFTDLSTGNPTSWVWTFEGGTPNSHNGQTPPTILYATPGSFDVTLVVTNPWGSNTMTKQDYITAGHIPVADFSGNPTTVIEGLPVAFTDLSLNNPTTWEWVFEGGTPATSSDQNPIVVFHTPGSFDVTLTAINAFGSNQITKNDYIVVQPVGVSSLNTRQVTLWPNPSSGVVNILLPQEGMQVRVFNTRGQVVYSRTHTELQHSIDLTVAGQGFYILEAVNSDGSVIGRIKLMIR